MDNDKQPSKKPDISGTVSDGKEPPKNIKLFLSKKIWISIISFVVLTIIGGIIQFSVQTPLTMYIEKLTGPSVRTLRTQLEKGNYEFVYRAIKPKFHDEPFDKRYESLYLSSADNLLKSYLKEFEWDKAAQLLDDAVNGMPVSTDFRTQLRRFYMQAQPERFRLFKKNERNASDANEQLAAMWKGVQQIALKQGDDALIQLEAGKTLAECNWYADRYNADSLEYFEKALTLDPALKDTDIISKTIKSALKEFYSGHPTYEKALAVKKMLNAQNKK